MGDKLAQKHRDAIERRQRQKLQKKLETSTWVDPRRSIWNKSPFRASDEKSESKSDTTTTKETLNKKSEFQSEIAAHGKIAANEIAAHGSAPATQGKDSNGQKVDTQS